MSPQDWLDLSAHNRRPPERKVFGRESGPRRRSINVDGAMLVLIVIVSATISGAVLWGAVRYLLAAGWTL